MVFNAYAKYYNLLYKDKDYNSEIEYICKHINNNIKKDKITILDIGCGTGKHATLLSKKGFKVVGIDLSQEMINIANDNRSENDTTEFYQADAISFDLNKKFDVVLSLFHVISYLNTNFEIKCFMDNVSRHLTKDGIFIFDFWYGPAVLSIKPSVRIKKLQNSEVILHRIAESDLYIRKNIVNVNYNVLVKNKLDNVTTEINEIHKMRYYFETELELYLSNFGFVILKIEEWLTSIEPSTDTWGVCCISKFNEQ